jgi:hypothetical protein
MKWSKDKIDILKDNYYNFGSKYCSKLLGVSISSIQNKAFKLKLNVNPTVKSSLLSESQGVTNIDYNSFVKLDTPEIIYFLGLFWADGYMYQNKNNSTIGIGLVEGDMKELEPHLDKIGKWNKRINDSKKISSWKPTKSLLTNNKRLYDFLVSFDFKDKSLKSADKILGVVPENLKHYFFRGLIDGDGCFYINTKSKSTQRQFSISSTTNQDWTYIIDIFNRLGIKKYKINIGKGSNIRVVNKEGIVKMGDYIYQNYRNDKIGLLRKYNKFIEIKNS